MRNLFKDYGWDRNDSKQSSFTPEQEPTLKALIGQIDKLQEEAKKNRNLNDGL